MSDLHRMISEDAFIRAILDNPADVMARLALADWLEEQGDARAELFRLQYALTQSIDVENRAALEVRQQQLLDAGVPPAMPLVVNALGMSFALIPAGEFLMGSHPREPGRFESEQRHRVKITRPFLMGLTPVTQHQYAEVTARYAASESQCKPSYFSRHGRGSRTVDQAPTGESPVESASWDDAMEFCGRLTALERTATWESWEGIVPKEAPGEESPLTEHGSSYVVFRPDRPWKDGVYHATSIKWFAPPSPYRLPTEAEWEYACRAGTTTAWCFGDDVGRLREFANYHHPSYSGRTSQVGKRRPNAFGLSDMHGNVWEWCWDFWGEYDLKDTVDPQGPKTGRVHVIRGGSWQSTSHVTRSASRDLNPNQGNDTGFRICRTL